MSHQDQPVLSPLEIVRTLYVYRYRWIIPTVAVTLLALAYAFLHSATWEATQALVLRDEAIGNLHRPGRFNSTEDMKQAQETLLELAKSRSVVTAALQQVGSAGAPPAAEDIQKTQGAIEVRPPKGAEFGTTEVIYLKVKDKTSPQAVALTKAVCDQLDARVQQLRDHKAQSLMDELTKTVELAKVDLDQATGRLEAMERQVGEDLAELRILNESASGESNLRQTLIEIKNELRQAQIAERANRQLREMLTAAKSDPVQLAAIPNRLLESQPGLRQLKDGLVAAQLQTATLRGQMSESHPRVQAALAAEAEIRRNLHNELRTATGTLDAELRLNADRVASLERQQDEISGRMTRLAELRATYGNLVDEVRKRNEILNQAQQELADARASQAAAQSVSLLTRLDGPTAGDSPAGPRKAFIVLAGVFGGLVTGLGVVFLTAPIAPVPQVSHDATSGNRERQHRETGENNGDTWSEGLTVAQVLDRFAQAIPSRN